MIKTQYCRVTPIEKSRKVPEGSRNGDKGTGLVVCLLCKEDERGEADDADEEKEHEEAELAIRARERVSERLQAGRVTRELQHAEDAQHTQDLQDAPQVRKALHRRCLHREVHELRHVVRHDRREIDEVHRADHKAQLPRRANESQHELQRKPHCAYIVRKLLYSEMSKQISNRLI